MIKYGAKEINPDNKLIVGIYNETGKMENGIFEITRDTTGTKNIIKIKNIKTGGERLIPKDRLIFGNGKRSQTVDKKPIAPKVAEPKKKAKKKKAAPKFDLNTLSTAGVLFKSKNKGSMEAGGQKISIEIYCLVSPDATKWKHFNLYNHSLGKKGKPPEFGESDTVKVELSGSLDNITKYLEKKDYVKVSAPAAAVTA